jgi:hypothetical protein
MSPERPIRVVTPRRWIQVDPVLIARPEARVVRELVAIAETLDRTARE